MARIAGRLALAVCVSLAATAGALAQLAPEVGVEAPAKVAIQARRIDAFDPREPQRRQFGALQFRGGVELTGSHKQFGGLSSIRVDADGAHFLAISDRGYWLRGRITYDGTAPSGIADAEIAPMLYSDGKPITARGWYDSEALALDGGAAYVALERVHRILKFDIGKSGLLARGALVPVPPEMGKLPSNRGIECMMAGPKGTLLAGALIAISERGLDEAKNLRGFLIGGRKPGLFAVKPADDFNVVDCAITPSGQVLLLERYFSWRRGLAMRLRRAALADIAPGALLEPREILTADMGYQIDNMEGLAVHRAQNGEIVLTLISDDNFSLIQRTLLLQFTLLEE